VRFYLSVDRIYYLFAAGKGYDGNHPNVQKFFASFAILDGARPRAGGCPAENVANNDLVNNRLPPRIGDENVEKDSLVLAKRPIDARLTVAGASAYSSRHEQWNGTATSKAGAVTHSWRLARPKRNSQGIEQIGEV